MVPYELLDTVVVGKKKLARFMMLNISARNWTENRSVTLNCRETPVSKFRRPGADRMFRPAFPNVPAGAICQAGLWPGWQFDLLPFARIVQVLNHPLTPGFATCQSPMTLGRSLF